VPSARYQAEIDASPDVVMSVITDFDSYTRFLPEIEACEIVRSGEDEWDVRFTVRIVKRLRYVLRLKQSGPLKIRWHLLEGAFKVNSGGWDLSSLADGTRTHVNYFIDLQVGIFVPSSIMRNAIGRSLPDTVGRFKAESERRSPTS
jgi:ribosome-associated toxin RatA of RatAB toxin-antitoxin module